MVTGQPTIASNNPSKSLCWSGSSSSSAAATAGLVLGHDHRPHLRLAIGGHEHMLGPAQPDSLGAEAVCAGGVLGGVGVRPHAELAQLVGPAQDGLESGVDVGLDERDVVGRDLAGRAIDRDEVARVQDEIADPHLAPLEVDVQRGRARDRGTAHAARHQRRVRSLAALRGQDPDGGVEPGDVVGLCERPHENDSGFRRRLARPPLRR